MCLFNVRVQIRNASICWNLLTTMLSDDKVLLYMAFANLLQFYMHT